MAVKSLITDNILGIYFILKIRISSMCGSHSRDHGINSADIVTPADLVISVFSPSLSPRILDDPVRLILETDRCKTFRSITD